VSRAVSVADPAANDPRVPSIPRGERH
jgi:hypothetical protein